MVVNSKKTNDEVVVGDELAALRGLRDAIYRVIDTRATQAPEERDGGRLVDSAELTRRLGISLSTLYRWRRDHPERLPPEVYGYSRMKWRLQDVEDFLVSRRKE